MSVASVISINILLARHFYPEVLSYQAGGVVGKYIIKEQINPENVFNLNVGTRSLDVYSHAIIQDIKPQQLDSLVGAEHLLYFYTDQKGKDTLLRSFKAEVILDLDDFSVTLLRMNFGNPKKRPETLRSRYFIKVES
ncbi:MAG: hypothetical protein WED33_11835 [Bacteroidia bacterium]